MIVWSDGDSGSVLLISHFLYIFLHSVDCILSLKICVTVFSGTIEAIILNLDNKLLYWGTVNETHCSYSSIDLSIFLYFRRRFVSHFFQELCSLQSSNMGDCIVGFRLKLVS